MWRAFAEGSGPRLCMREQAPSRGHLFLRGFKKMLIRKARIGSGERRAWGGERKAHGGGLSTCGGGAYAERTLPGQALALPAQPYR